MRKATIVSVTPDRLLEIPPEVQEKLNPGDEYIIWTTEDSILFKKIQKPLTYSELLKRIEAQGPDPNEMSLEEISELVNAIREEKANSENSSGH
ncbi:MAG: hypothetical protein ACFB8W_10960 [Elainellaceae cyanobacterium]|jgi:hypothetical protein